METLKIKGHEITPITIKDSFNRRAVQYKNKIIETLKKIGLKDDDIDIELAPVAFKKVPASVTWYFDGHHLYYSYKLASKYVENLYIVFKIIELEVNALISEEKTVEEFISEFSEEPEVEKNRKEARELLGVEDDVVDIKVIDEKYKKLAKQNHPDMPGGSAEKFKKINKAHKMLKRELR